MAEPLVKFDDGVMEHARELEKKYIEPRTGRLKENALKSVASKLPTPHTNLTSFKKQFIWNNKTKEYYIDTPNGTVEVNPRSAWRHLSDNTYMDNRTSLSGAFVDTLTDPLFVVKKPYKNTWNVVYYKPFVDEEGLYHLASFTVDNKGTFKHKTFFEYDGLNKVKGLIKVPEGDLLYVKGSHALNASRGGTTSHINVEKNPRGTSIAQKSDDVKKEVK